MIMNISTDQLEELKQFPWETRISRELSVQLRQCFDIIEKQREALEFYADSGNWVISGSVNGYSYVGLDHGRKAREALEVTK